MRRLSLLPAWMDDGACVGVDSNIFFPTNKNSPNVKAAQAICATCEIKDRCREWAIDREEAYGIWGGTTERQRRVLVSMKRKQGRRAS